LKSYGENEAIISMLSSCGFG